MSGIGELRDAALGWLDLLSAQPDAAARFRLDRAGLGNAVGFYLAMALLVVVIESALSGFPGWGVVLLSLLLNALQLAAVLALGALTARMVGADPTALVVPVAYAMGLILALSLPLGAVPGQGILVALLGVRGFLFYRAARGVAKMGIGVSLAFAILALVMLVAMTFGLYMLTMQGQGIV